MSFIYCYLLEINNFSFIYYYLIANCEFRRGSPLIGGRIKKSFVENISQNEKLRFLIFRAKGGFKVWLPRNLTNIVKNAYLYAIFAVKPIFAGTFGNAISKAPKMPQPRSKSVLRVEDSCK